MINPRHLLRAKRWAQNPPSEKRIKLIAFVLVACFGLFAVERWIGWPDWMTADRIGRIK